MTGCASAPPAPAQNVDPHRHPNLAAAQRACGRAFDNVSAAQQANEWDMGGHAKKAKELISQASDEIKQAALAANRH
jgi:hypothetical protein